MNNRHVVMSVHYLARALLLGCFAFFIVHLVRTEHLNLYIAGRMQLIVKLSALAMYAIAAQQLYASFRNWSDGGVHDSSCDCGHEMPATWGRSLLLYGWFALPLLIGFTVPDGLLGSDLATAKGVQFAPQQLVKPLESTVAADLLFPSDAFTEVYAEYGKQLVKRPIVQVTDKRFIETLTTLDLYRTAFIGKTITLSGFVYREGSMESRQFAVGRFAISCCSADASPYGIMAKFDKANTLETDDWVAVTGTLGLASYNGIEIIQIDVSNAVKIEPPKEPYVSPDLDFGME
ncbi:TIGR03943 family protein [Cohnella endophytica]|uniref:TIGR03943 family protein n=1 Tax=Cohnella endophytica TaxID=2419778 RepID=A0A494Y3T7_9BACL|nr:TIGR03943 family protein [Cohnella endophytica]RKP56115.1 TIGR03943 family protein [Cohnella endophytica]